MSLMPGLHIFYGNTSSNLCWIYCDGNQFKSKQLIAPAGLPPLTRGVSAAALGERIYIYCTCQGNTLHQVVMTYDAEKGEPAFLYEGQVLGVATQDESATVVRDALHVFYRDSDTQALRHISQSWGNWTRHADVLSGSPGIGWGPAAVLRTGGINLLYCNNDKNYLGCVWLDSSNNVHKMQPPQMSGGHTPALQSTPGACLLGDTIFVMHRSNDDKGNVFFATVDPYGAWNEQFMDGYQIFDGPCACVYGGKIFLFTQGTGNSLYCQIYFGGEWLPAKTQISIGSYINDVAWSPAAVAI